MPATAALQLVLLAAIWGASFLFMRIAAPQFGVPALITVRLLIAAVVLAPLLTPPRRAIIARHWKPLTILALVNSLIPFCLLAFATSTLSAGLPSIINATVPFFAALVAWLWLRERPKPIQWTGLAIGFAGVFVLMLPKLQSGLSASVQAVFVGMTGSFLYGFSAIFTRRRLAGVEPMAIAGGSTCIAALLSLPLGLVALPTRVPPLSAWLTVAALGAVCTGFAYVIFYRLLATIGATKAVTVTFLIPVFGVLWGTLFLNEPLTWNMAAGGGLVLLGMALLTGIWAALNFHTHAPRPPNP